MRITGGQARGRLLARVKGSLIRPTSDRVREAIFDLIGHQLEGECVLDLFAGTGSLGLEALSRGASKALFVDYSSKAIQIIRKNIELCGFAHSSKIVRRDLRKGLPAREPFVNDIFQLIFMDPPYRKGMIPIMMKSLGTSSFLSSGSLLIVESSKDENPLSSIGSFLIEDSRAYGDTRITIFSYEVKK